MKNVFVKIGLGVCALFFVTGCNYSLQKGGAPGGPSGSAGPGSGPSEPADPELNFENVFATSIQTSCFGCHAAPRNASGINLETYESVFENRFAIEQAVSSRRMPDSMGRAMNEEARDLLLRWLAAGAPLGVGLTPLEMSDETI